MEQYEKKIPTKERKRLLAFIKTRYPVGTEIFDDVRSGSFIIRKNSIFAVGEDNDLIRPSEESVGIEFLVRCPGKYSELWHVCYTQRKNTYIYEKKQFE